VQAKVEIKLRLSFQPRNVRPRLGGFGVAVIAVQINALRVFAPVQSETDGIQARQQKNLRVRRPAVCLKQF
jgi:hypothetical protein